MQLLLAAVVVLPLLGAVAALLPAPPGLRGRDPEQAVLRHGVTVTGLVLALSVALAIGFDYDRAEDMQATTDIRWIPALDIRIHLGIDGISLPLLVMTALLTFLCALYSYFRMPPGGSPTAFVALLLVLEAGTLATFAVLDLMLFFLAFEMVLIPMYFLIARWGGQENTAGPTPTGPAAPAGSDRERAAWRFILYTLLGSVVMLLGLLLIGLKGGTFDMVALASDNGAGLSHSTQVIAVLAIGIGLAVKAPMWPLHSWLPDAHTAAPTVGSVLLAGVLLKMGTYGLVRIALPMAPDGAHTLAPYLAAFAVVGILYGSLACLALALPTSGRSDTLGPTAALTPARPKADLKRLIAYSSVGHMGFVLLGIATLTPTGVNGALFANIAHGLITGLLFFLVGALKERFGSTDLDQLAGGARASGAALYGRAPRLGGLLAFGAVASLGLPGLAGFWGEMLAMFGAYEPADGLSRPAYLTFLALAGLGTLLTAAYLLIVVRRVCMGEPAAGGALATAGAPAPDGTPATAVPAAVGAPTAASGATRTAATPPGAAPTDAAPTDTAAPDTGSPGLASPAAAATVGSPRRDDAIADVRGHELAAWTPLVVLTVLAGLWPAALLGLTDPAVQHLLGGGS
ncbi:NADH-quinone oxidoreductase subunit M [Streptomyces sp. 71268]|uniref:complex I subunit 4 family protein n=1 Tax=Streptomyces sp. 71268 TaxID=3002640 RepID=UPI0023F874A3|nr:NADH-quinone oxidoreductase subunit M [Streptomyces sp. 71268]WEV29749.1 NADH-quinone oxidoreductase subunit M [Streptomyces sp. 71268]